MKNTETSHKEKVLWIFAAIFISWLAFILFTFMAPVFPNDDEGQRLY